MACKIHNVSAYPYGDTISRKEVTGLVKKLLGEDSRTTRFLTNSALQKKARNGEELLSLYENGVLYFENTPQGINELYVRHELIHKVYNEYLTPAEQETVRKYVDPASIYTPEAMEEKLADAYVDYQKGKKFPDFIERILNAIRRLFNYIGGNKDGLREFFNKIDAGKYKDKKINHDPIVRRTLSKIRKEWGSVSNYLQGSSWITNITTALLHTGTESKDNAVSWRLQSGKRKDSVDYRVTRDEILGGKNSILFTTIQWLHKAINTHLDGSIPLNNATIDGNVKMTSRLNKISSLLYLETDKLLNLPEDQRTAAMENALGYLTPLLKLRNVNAMLTDVYRTPPNILDLSDLVDFFDPFTDTDKASEAAEKLQEHIFENDTYDREIELRDNISDFLHSIYYTDSKGVKRSLDKRVGYVIMSLMFRNTDPVESNFGKQVQFNVSLIGTPAAEAVYEQWINLHNFSSKDRFGEDFKELPNAKFISNSEFIYETDPTNPAGELALDKVYGLDGLAEINSKRLAAGFSTIEIVRKTNPSTVQFFDSILQVSGLPDGAISVMWDNHYHENMLSEVESYFGSQREMSFFLGNEKGYIKGQTLGYAKGIGENLTNGLKNLIDLTPDKVGGTEWIRVKDDLKASNAVDKERGIRRFFSLAGVHNIYFENALPLTLIGKPVNDIIGYMNQAESLMEKRENLHNTRKNPIVGKVVGENQVVKRVIFDGEYIAANYKSLVDTVSNIVASNLDLSRASSIISLEGKRRYRLSNGSTAYDVLDNLVNYNATNSHGYVQNPHVKLLHHLNKDFYKYNPLINGTSALYEVVDHDGIKTDKVEVTYAKETQEETILRMLHFGFANFYTQHDKKLPRYVQFLPPLGDRNRAIGGVVKMLNPKEQRDAFDSILTQVAARTEEPRFSNYDRNDLLGLGLVGEAFRRLARNGTPLAVKVTANQYKLNTKDGLDDFTRKQILSNPKFVDQLYLKYLEVVKQYSEGMVETVGALPTRTKEAIPELLKFVPEVVRKDLTDPAAQIVAALTVQYTLNGYALNQAVFGDLAQYGNYANLLKRASLPFAPGLKGKVDNDGFMQAEYKVGVLQDLKLNFNELSELFKGQEGIYEELLRQGMDFYKANGDSVQKVDRFKADEAGPDRVVVTWRGADGDHLQTYTDDEFATMLANEYPHKVGVDITDGQNYMLPERVEELKKGFGLGYNFGNVLKPIHFGPINKEGTPIMAALKQSSIVLTNDLVSRIPVLDKLRTSMRANKLQEVSFASAVKLGNIEPASMNQDGTFNITESNVLSLSNRDYRLQLNPKSDLNSTVALPTQMTFFPNLIQSGETQKNAAELYSLYQSIFDLNTILLKKRLITNSGDLNRQVLTSSISSTPGNELIGELLDEGVSFDMPVLSTRLFYQLTSLVTKSTVKPTFKGSKLVLQSSFGANALSEADSIKANRLEYKLTEDGKLLAEVLVSKELADTLNVTEVGGEFISSFDNGDAFGFRIPSTGLHSGVALKIVGIYDEGIGNNVVIAPAEIVPIQGLDFDVDSMFVIRRSRFSDFSVQRGVFEDANDDQPIGYLKRDGKWVVDKDFESFMWNLIRDETDTRLTNTYYKILIESYKNRAVEQYLNIITHPDSRSEMIKPISTRYLDEVLDSPELKHLNAETPDITTFSGALKGLDLVRVGRNLTGAFANLAKTYSYLMKGSKESGPVQLNVPFQLNGHTYTGLSINEVGNNRPVIDTFDLLINSAIDNLKELQLKLIQADANSVNFYGALLMMGVDLKTAIAVVTHPQMQTLIKNRAKPVQSTRLNVDITLEELAKREKSVGITELYGKLSKIAGDIFDVTNVFSLVQEMPHEPIRIDRVDQSLENIGTIYDTGLESQEYLEELNEINKDRKELIPIIKGGLALIPNPSFAFDITHLFRNQANLAAAYGTYTEYRSLLTQALYKFSPQVDQVVETVSDLIQKSHDSRLNPKVKSRIRDEFLNYCTCYIYPDVLNHSSSYMRHGVVNDLTGASAWVQDFATTFQQRADQLLSEGKAVKFLNSISVRETRGLKALSFQGGGNVKTTDYLALQESFEELTENGEYTQFQQDFLKYAILTSGGQLNTSAITNVIPAALYDEASIELDDFIAEIEDKEGNLVEHFATQLVAKYPDLLPFSSERALEPVVHGSTSGPWGERIPEWKGKSKDGVYYDLAVPKDNASGSLLKLDDSFSTVATYVKLGEDAEHAFYAKMEGRNATYVPAEDVEKKYIIGNMFEADKLAIPVNTLLNIPPFHTVATKVEVGDQVYFYRTSDLTRNKKIYGRVISTDGINVRVELIANVGKASVTQTIPTEPSKVAVNAVVPVLNDRFNLNMRLVSNDAIKAKFKEENGIEVTGILKGYVANDGSIFINEEYHTDDTPFHETAHIFVEALKQTNPTMYAGLLAQFIESSEGQVYIERINSDPFYNKTLNPEQRTEEAFIQAVGNEAVNSLLSSTNSQTPLQRLISRVMKFIHALIHDLFSPDVVNWFKKTNTMLNPRDLAFTNLKELAKYISTGTGGIDLGGTTFGKGIRASMSEQLDINTVEVEENDIGEPITIKLNNEELPSLRNWVFNLGQANREFLTNPSEVRRVLAEEIVDERFKQENKGVGDEVILENGVAATKEAAIAFYTVRLEQGAIKSKIVHTALERALTDNPLLSTKIANLRVMTGRVDAYKWADNPANIELLIKKSKLDVSLEPGATQEDTLHFNFGIGDSLLGGDVVDLLVEHTDGTMSIVNYQTSTRYKNTQFANLFRYGNKSISLMNTPEGRAKALTMLNALTIKLRNPDAKFRRLSVIPVPNEESLKITDPFTEVESQDYLSMYEDFFRNEHPDIYQQLVNRSPAIFNAAEYNELQQSYIHEADKNNITFRDLLQKKKDELQMYVMRLKHEHTDPERNEHVRALTQEIAEMEKNSTTSLTLTRDNVLGLGERWLGDFADLNDPYLQTYRKIADKHELEFKREYDAKVFTFRKLLAEAVPETKLGNYLAEGFKTKDPEKIYGWMFTENEVKTDEGVRVTRDLITKSDSNYDSQVNTQAKVKFLDFVQDNFKEGLEILKGVAYTKEVNGRKVEVTHLDLAQKKAPESKGFFPRVAITNAELRRRKGGLSKDYLNYLKAKLFSDFNAQVYENLDAEDFGLPIKYLGNTAIAANPDMYTVNVELAFNRFMSGTLAKKHMDQVYAIGTGVKNIFKQAKGPNSSELYAPSINFLKDKINLDLLNKPSETHRGWVIGNYKGKTLRLSYFQLVKTLKSAVSAMVMWVNPIGAGINTASASILTIKEGIRGQLIDKLSGIDSSVSDFTATDLVWAMNEWGKLQADYIGGNQETNKVHLLLRKFDYLPTTFDWATREEHLYTANMPFVNQSTFYVLHTAPEEALATFIMLAQLRNMKVNKPGSTHHGKSLYEMYDVVDGELQWKDGFTRGVLDNGEAITEVTSEEVAKMYRVYQRIHGGYRGKEKTPIEAYVLGQLFIQFKRWLPGMLMTNLKKRGTDFALGQYQIQTDPSGELRQLNGEPVVRWVSRISEGRWWVLGKHIGNAINIVKHPEYKWSNLSDEQKAGLLDVYVTLGMWSGMIAAYLAIFGDVDDDDSWKTASFEVINRSTEFYNAMELYRNMTQIPPVIERGVNASVNSFIFAGAVGLDAAGYEEIARTSRGKLRGQTELQKSIPLVSQSYRINKFIDKSDDLSDFFEKYR